mmetsp:Transcript_20433/g.37146  ORF Transcript_20433/g.37146 Transcript_20433/m.37146 type:complete len:280 (-) Transcript_20433:173-1012(-)
MEAMGCLPAVIIWHQRWQLAPPAESSKHRHESAAVQLQAKRRLQLQAHAPSAWSRSASLCNGLGHAVTASACSAVCACGAKLSLPARCAGRRPRGRVARLTSRWTKHWRRSCGREAVQRALRVMMLRRLELLRRCGVSARSSASRASRPQRSCRCSAWALGTSRRARGVACSSISHGRLQWRSSLSRDLAAVSACSSPIASSRERGAGWQRLWDAPLCLKEELSSWWRVVSPSAFDEPHQSRAAVMDLDDLRLVSALACWTSGRALKRLHRGGDLLCHA